ncbi:hypothetical protein WMY93_026490 [Mugilogobius chulae]|uniref:Rho guanine nucleotide exchange factor 1 n=1 Tax=Mugilogobius chulae TaxID=88201 RepID=A0AAW0MZ74_9GOBI
MDAEDALFGRGVFGAPSSNPAMSIIGAEDEEFENDLNDVGDDQCKYFSSIDQLKDHPAHLLAFIQHVILQFDPAPLLCYLHGELLKNLSAKEIKKQFVEFNNNFLDKGAILRVTVPNTTSEVDRTRPELLSEETQRRYVQEVQSLQSAEVARQLEDFRTKRMMGMTPCEPELIDVENHYPTDRIPMDMKEKSVAENILDKMAESQPTIVSDEEKCQSIFSAVAYYMKHMGVKTRAVDSKKSRGGFFKIPLGRSKRDEISKTKPNPFTGIKNWMGGNPEPIKPKPEEAPSERKVPTSVRGSVSEPSPGGRKSVTGVVPVVQCPTLDIPDGVGNNSSTANSPEVLVSISDGHLINRLEPSTVSDGGDSSPIGLVGGLSIVEPQSSSDTPTEENVNEKDSFEGPALVADLPGASPTSPSPQLEEVEPRLLEFEQDPPNWRELASPDVLSGLSKKEMKRQEVINELFATEHAHVRMLSVLQMIFSKPLERQELLTGDEVAAIFPNLDEIIEMHYNFYENLKVLRLDDGFIVKSISTTVLNRFGGTEGSGFRSSQLGFAVTSHGHWNKLKAGRKRATFNAFIRFEAESKPQCRRLQLKDIIPIEMQRLTKYPLLLENIAKNTEDSTEKERIQQSAECCRKILNHVNEEVKMMENLLNIDLTQKRMLFEGPLTWKVTKEKTIDVQCVLLGDMLVLLQKLDDKMVLKCQSKSNITAQEGKMMLSPIIKLDSVFLREVATDRKAFYVIFTWDSGAQIYELVAQSVGERKTWTEVIKKAVDDLKKSGASMKLPLPISGVPTALSQRDKDSLTDEKSSDPRHSLIDFLSDKGFDLIAHSNSDQEKVANSALDEVMSLKRLLVGSISFSEDSPLDEKLEEELSEKTSDATESTQPTEENSNANTGAEEENNQPVVKDVAEKTVDESISAPMVLSQERMEEVCRRLYSLEKHLKKLQAVEEEHHRLHEALSKFSLERRNFH